MFFLQVFLAGVVGTTLMTASLWFIHRSGWANADMTRALGSMLTRRYDGSLGPGLLVHFTGGIAFAVPYLLILRSAGFAPLSANLAVGGAIGAFHGLAMSYVLMALVAGRHPVEKFRSAGPEVGAAHIVGHIAYGLGVGLTAWLLGGRALPPAA
jgi:uncharacterized membrane protein YagU involved in acid resistance